MRFNEERSLRRAFSSVTIQRSVLGTAVNFYIEHTEENVHA